MARHDAQRLMDAMLVAGLKMCAHDNIAERDWRLHKHNAGRPGFAEQRQDLGEEVQERHFEAFEVRSGRIGRRAIILDAFDNHPGKIWFADWARFFSTGF